MVASQVARREAGKVDDEEGVGWGVEQGDLTGVAPECGDGPLRGGRHAN